MKLMEWSYDEEHDIWEIYGKDCYVWMDKRPKYCDRGQWLAHVEGHQGMILRDVEEVDMWPRYYFDLERAKLEVEAWIEKRDRKK